MRVSTLIVTLIGLCASSVSAACTCQKVSDPGLYCGYCTQVLTGKVREHAYECSKSGSCHDYGYSSRCADSNPNIYCDGRDTWGKMKRLAVANMLKREADVEAPVEE